MGIFDFLFKKATNVSKHENAHPTPHIAKISETDYVMDKIKTGSFYGQTFEPDDEVEVNRKPVYFKPVHTSLPDAQRVIPTLSVGERVHLLYTEGDSGGTVLFMDSDHKIFGDISIKADSLLADMLEASVDVECYVHKTGQFFASGLGKELWFCELMMADYDVWSTKGANVWTTETGKLYHKDKSCYTRATQHMREDEAIRRGKEPCPKCATKGTCQ